MAPFRSDLFIAAAVLVLASISSLAAWGWIRYVGKRDAEKSARLEDALEDNRLLLREIHHRVKNNFQGVQSVIRMHQLPADAQKLLFDRIGAMIAVHEQIYGRDQFSAIGANNLIPSIVDKLISAYSDNVAARYDIEDFYLDPDQATPVALLVTEVVTNSLKYAYPDGRQGTLTISLRRHGDLGATLVIADDGVGFNPDDVRRGMGSRLIRGVMGQLRGSFEYKFQGGTVFTAQLALIPRK